MLTMKMVYTTVNVVATPYFPQVINLILAPVGLVFMMLCQMTM